ncbi:MAG: cytochrome P450 [Deltaproteobacteria bacterium]|nr:cytochrome P450 [Deltaproteobacteria bacterium]
MSRLVYDPTDPDQLERINEVYARLREESPVHYAEKFDIYVVSRHADVEAILKDTERFSSRGANTALAYTPPEVAEVLAEGRPEAEALLTADPPRHARHRALVNRALTQRRVDQKRPRMQALAHALIDQFEAQGRADLIAAFGVPYPLNVIAEVMGIPEADRAQLKAWSSDFVARFSPDLSIEDRKQRARGFVAFQRYFEQLILAAKRDGRDDFMGDFARAAFAEPPVSMEDQLTTLMQTVVAGHETTTNLIGGALVHLLTNASVRERLAREPQLMPAFIEEVLRLETPTQALFRTANVDVTLHGVTIPAGKHVQILYGSANRDPAAFPNPNALDLDRDDLRGHLAFGLGIHFCPGAPLARTDTLVALEALTQRLPGLRLVAGAALVHTPHFFLRGYQAVHCEWR